MTESCGVKATAGVVRAFFVATIGRVRNLSQLWQQRRENDYLASPSDTLSHNDSYTMTSRATVTCGGTDDEIGKIEGVVVLEHTVRSSKSQMSINLFNALTQALAQHLMLTL